MSEEIPSNVPLPEEEREQKIAAVKQRIALIRDLLEGADAFEQYRADDKGPPNEDRILRDIHESEDQEREELRAELTRLLLELKELETEEESGSVQ